MRAAAEIATHHAGEIATAAAEVAGLGLEGLIDGPTGLGGGDGRRRRSLRRDAR